MIVGPFVLLALVSLALPYSPLFQVQRITVEGASSLNATTLEQALSGQIGRPLGLVDRSEIKAALVTFPLIASYAVESRPPHDVVVRIVERVPVGVIETNGQFLLVDGAGVTLSQNQTRPEGYPLLTVDGTHSVGFTAAALVLRSLPESVRSQVASVTATTMDDVTLALTTGTTVVWGSSDDSELKAYVLNRAISSLPGQPVYDVSSPNMVLTR